MTINEVTIKVKEIFSFYNLNIRMLSGITMPALILDNTIALSCFIKENNLILLNQPKAGNEVYRIDLSDDNYYHLEEIINTWITQFEHRKLFKVSLSGTELSYCGFHEFKNKKYPIFSVINNSVFFSKKRAQEILDLFLDFNLEIV